MWYNPIMKWLIGSPLHFFVSDNMMLITYKGRRSGKEFTTPVSYFPAQDEFGEYIAITSTTERTWWRNLRGGAPVTLRLKGRDREAMAEVIEAQDGVTQGIVQFISRTPKYARYFQVALDENGLPNPDDAAKYAQGKVLIKARLD